MKWVEANPGHVLYRLAALFGVMAGAIGVLWWVRDTGSDAIWVALVLLCCSAWAATTRAVSVRVFDDRVMLRPWIGTTETIYRRDIGAVVHRIYGEPDEAHLQLLSGRLVGLPMTDEHRVVRLAQQFGVPPVLHDWLGRRTPDREHTPATGSG